MGNAASSLKQMRVIHFVFLVALVLYAYTAEFIVGKTDSEVSAAIIYGMTLVAAFDVLIAYYFRRTKLAPALERLRLDPNDSEALKQWRYSTLVSLVLTLSVGLYGFTLRFLRAPQKVAWSFYLVALILLLIWRPTLALPAEAPGMPRDQ